MIVFPLGSRAHDRNTIEGVVVDQANQPVANIWVRLYRGEKEIGNDTTRADGSYSIEFDRGDSLSAVRFDDVRTDALDRYHPSLTSNLSGKTDQKVNKVMPGKVGRALGPWQDLELVSTYERLHVLDQTESLEGMRAELPKRYAVNLGMWKPTGLAMKRLAQVRGLYTNH